MSIRSVLRWGAMLMALSLAIVSGAQAQFAEQQRLTASDASAGDRFGGQVSMSGNRLVIGAIGEDRNGFESGSAYVFERQGNGRWQQVAKLFASDGGVLERFSSSVSISGGHIVIGASHEGPDLLEAGAAYVFERQGNGDWQEVEKLTASDAEPGDFFGDTVSVSGNRLVVSATGDDELGELAGSAYVFERISGRWQEVAKLTASDGGARDGFGGSMSISGSRIVFGLPRNDDLGRFLSSVYVFERQGNGDWQEVAQLTASDADADDRFGGSVSIDGRRLAVSAIGDDDHGDRSGAVYVFERQGSGNWREVEKLVASDRAPGGGFGSQVSLSGDRLLIGATRINGGNNRSAIYAFERQGSGRWQEVQKLTASDGLPPNVFGSRFSLSGERFVVGALGDSENGSLAGAAYVFGISDAPPPPPPPPSVSCDCENATVVGTDGDDVLVGQQGDDVICGFGGNDRITDHSGQNCIDGGDGDDRIIGGSGDDVLVGGSGNDDLRGFGGDDILIGDEGDDILNGNEGRDNLSGGNGNDLLRGSQGDDTLSGDDGDDDLRGGSGDDLLLGGDGDDRLNGSSGIDDCRGGAGTDMVSRCE